MFMRVRYFQLSIKLPSNVSVSKQWIHCLVVFFVVFLFNCHVGPYMMIISLRDKIAVKKRKAPRMSRCEQTFVYIVV